MSAAKARSDAANNVTLESIRRLSATVSATMIDAAVSAAAKEHTACRERRASAVLDPGGAASALAPSVSHAAISAAIHAVAAQKVARARRLSGIVMRQVGALSLFLSLLSAA